LQGANAEVQERSETICEHTGGGDNVIYSGVDVNKLGTNINKLGADINMLGADIKKLGGKINKLGMNENKLGHRCEQVMHGHQQIQVGMLLRGVKTSNSKVDLGFHWTFHIEFDIGFFLPIQSRLHFIASSSYLYYFPDGHVQEY